MLSFAINAQNIITSTSEPGNFSLKNVSIYTDAGDDWLVQKAAAFLQQDIELVTGVKPPLVHNAIKGNVIVVGTISGSAMIEMLIKNEKLSVKNIQSKWDAYQVTQVKAGMLVITGSNKRGVAYGVFELSGQMGVSPWYWWADVPVVKRTNVFVKKGSNIFSAPSVKYRGIFLNDEAPALSGWAKEKFGGFNHLFYEKVFELMLRLKANYLWPAMWGSAFNDDDSLNPIVADNYGIVMGTSHHEPMMRAHDEWRRYGVGKWNYDSNAERLNDFWKNGIERMKSHESIVTVGMRGDGDEPMSEESNIALLEKIVNNQRHIIEDVTGNNAEQQPQMWALYKEVQDYYDKGMRVPDDVTLLLCDDNWGNIRKLPRVGDAPRKGGYGIYYHFDYVGGPRNYKWLNTVQISRTWEQMRLAYEYGARQLWIVNVGDLKPMELPISFFLEHAWNAASWNVDSMSAYTQKWAAQQFGNTYAKSIAHILTKYTQYNARRKPELLNENTYSLFNYNEANRIVNEYNSILKQAENIHNKISDDYKPAFYQLVLFPVKACANLNEMYVAVAKNKFFADEGMSVQANEWAAKAKACFEKDAQLTAYYNDTLLNGKWRHMMDQTHIGYTYWQQPETNVMPAVKWFDTTGVNENIDVAVKSVADEKGYTSLSAAHFTKAISSNGVRWQVIPDIGRTGDGITPLPVTAKAQKPEGNSPRLEYEVVLDKKVKNATVSLYFSPTLNFNNGGLRYAVSFDDDKPQIINIHEGMTNKKWEEWVANNIIISNTKHTIAGTGKHTLKFWMVDPALVLQKIVIDYGGVKQSYLGPPSLVEN